MGKARKLTMKTTFRRRGIVLAAALVLLWAVSTADTGGGPASFVGTGWALLPPAVAIVLAFVTKEVYSSLLAGCVMGALLAEGFAPWRSFETLFLTLMEGIDRKIFFFDVLLGAIVVLFARSGGSRAFGEWASRRVRSRRGAETATAGPWMPDFPGRLFQLPDGGGHHAAHRRPLPHLPGEAGLSH